MNRKNIKKLSLLLAVTAVIAILSTAVYAAPPTSPFEGGRKNTDTDIGNGAGNGYGTGYGINGNNNSPAGNNGEDREFVTSNDNNSIIGEIDGNDNSGNGNYGGGTKSRSRTIGEGIDNAVHDAEHDGDVLGAAENNGGVIGIIVAIAIAVAVIILIIALIPKSTGA